MEIYICKCSFANITIEFKILARGMDEAIRKADDYAFENFVRGFNPDIVKSGWEEKRTLTIKEME